MKICRSLKQFGMSPNELTSPFVLVFSALNEKIKSAVKRNSWRVTEKFHDAVLGRLMIQNTTMLKANARRR
ncbi:hypothetical protein H5410_014817 [Solanum commersonii]|uniref:Uncharacterized protein n=1 Tax=Solanum commersonii TaxID=4109 RepID=A0A9J5ZS06_SOLCO|nr:hypothetical protein H5410_014817 [Solanum commersonii]